MRFRTGILPVVPICILLFSLNSFPLLRIGVDGGVSRSDVAGSEDWRSGFVIGASLFIAPSNLIQFGVRGAYNRWSPNADTFLNRLPGDLADPEITGNGTVWELIPAIRVAALIPGSQVGFFGHFGAGLHFLDTRVEAGGTQLGTPFTQTFVDTTETNWGLNFGLGISVGRLLGAGIEILPLYHVIDIGDNPRQYFTVSAALTYEF